MNQPLYRLAIALAAVAGAPPATATDLACFRHSDCDGDLLCIDRTCTAPDTDLFTCAVDSDCVSLDGCTPVLCDEGVCKGAGVFCTNPAGIAYRMHTRGAILCETGICTDFGIEDPPDPPLTEQALYDACRSMLSESCGDVEPDILDMCTESQLQFCQRYYDHYNAVSPGCGAETIPTDFAHLFECCRALELNHKALYYCINKVAVGDCAGFNTCLAGGGTDLDPADFESDGSGCTLGPVSSAGKGRLFFLFGEILI